MEIEHAGQPRFIFHGDCLSSVFETQHICEPAHRTLRERKAFHAIPIAGTPPPLGARTGQDRESLLVYLSRHGFCGGLFHLWF